MARKVSQRPDPGVEPDQRRVAAGRRDPGGDAREAPADDRRGRQEGRADPLPAGDLQRPVLLPGQDKRWYDAAEPVPGPTVEKLAADREEVQDGDGRPGLRAREAGVYYNTAAVIDADGTYLGKYRKNHIPQTSRASGRSTSSSPGNLGYPVFQTRVRARSASTSATTATSPRARARSACNGAEIVFNPSATVAGLSQYLWKLEQPAHAVANGYFVGAINRVGTEAPWNIGKFYGTAYFVDPRGQILAVRQRGQGRARRRRARPRR